MSGLHRTLAHAQWHRIRPVGTRPHAPATRRARLPVSRWGTPWRPSARVHEEAQQPCCTMAFADGHGLPIIRRPSPLEELGRGTSSHPQQVAPYRSFDTNPPSRSSTRRAPVAAMVAALAREVIVLNEKIGEIDRQIEASFRRHKQAAIIASMPGMGDLLGAENLAAIGGGMDLFGSPDRLATYAGLAPAPRDSGRVSGSRHRPISPTSATGFVPGSQEQHHLLLGFMPVLRPQTSRRREAHRSSPGAGQATSQRTVGTSPRPAALRTHAPGGNRPVGFLADREPDRPKPTSQGGSHQHRPMTLRRPL